MLSRPPTNYSWKTGNFVQIFTERHQHYFNILPDCQSFLEKWDAYILDQRKDHPKQYTDHQAIASRTGFSSHSYFAKKYKGTFGVRPSERRMEAHLS